MMVHGKPLRDYLQRSATVIRNSITPALEDTVNYIDKSIRLVFHRDGPSLHNAQAVVENNRIRRAGNILYTHDFAEALRSELLCAKAKMRPAITRMIMRACEADNPLVSLYPSHTRYWWPLAEDIFYSPAADKLLLALHDALLREEEFKSISIDTTMRCAFPVIDQKGQRTNRRKLMTVRGRTSCVIDMVPLPSDQASVLHTHFADKWTEAARNMVTYITVDNPSPHFVKQCKKVFPNLVCMSLDTVHLAMNYEYATWRKRTDGSKAVRALMTKFCRTDASVNAQAWGDFHHGNEVPVASPMEAAFRERVLDLGMNPSRASRILNALDYSKPWASRCEFVEALAAVASRHSEDMGKIAPGPNKKVMSPLHNPSPAQTHSPRLV